MDFTGTFQTNAKCNNINHVWSHFCYFIKWFLTIQILVDFFVRITYFSDQYTNLFDNNFQTCFTWKANYRLGRWVGSGVDPKYVKIWWGSGLSKAEPTPYENASKNCALEGVLNAISCLNSTIFWDIFVWRRFSFW